MSVTPELPSATTVVIVDVDPDTLSVLVPGATVLTPESPLVPKAYVPAADPAGANQMMVPQLAGAVSVLKYCAVYEGGLALGAKTPTAGLP